MSPYSAFRSGRFKNRVRPHRRIGAGAIIDGPVQHAARVNLVANQERVSARWLSAGEQVGHPEFARECVARVRSRVMPMTLQRSVTVLRNSVRLVDHASRSGSMIPTRPDAEPPHPSVRRSDGQPRPFIPSPFARRIMASVSILLPSVVAIGLLLALSAFFSSSESAIFSLSEEWVRTAASDGRRETRTLQQLRSDPHRLLVTILVGNNLVNIALTSIVTLVVAGVAPPGVAVVLATLVVGVLILVFGEIVPKSYGLGHATSWSLRVARPVSYVELALGPLVTVFDVVTGWLTTSIGGDQHIEETYLGE